MRRLAGEDPQVNDEWNCDKGRFAFHYATQADRLLEPMIRDESGALVPASWPAALERAAAGLRKAVEHGGVGVLPGGRLTEEDAYAYAKFARLALGTNDIDMRARPGSAEELDFLAAHVAGTTPQRVSYASLEAAPAVLLAGFEPEDESPIVFLRMRKATRRGRMAVYALAPLATGGVRKLSGTLLPVLPGGEAAALANLDGAVTDALSQPGAVILVGERLAGSPGALSAASALAQSTGAALAWVPRRAGEVGAVDAGALPTLLPGGRGVDDAQARAEIEELWGAAVPAAPGRDTTAILRAVAGGALPALVVGAVEPADLPDPDLAAAALARAEFVVSLEIRASAVTAQADVVLPVAPMVEKSGRFVTWEGRRRPFEVTLDTGALSDAQVLDALADELDVVLGLRSVAAIRAELASVSAPRPSAGTMPTHPATHPEVPTAPKQALLATWHEVIDAGRGQDGDENLAGTAKPARALLSAATAEEVGVTDGDTLTVSTERGLVTLPVRIDDLPDRVVWLPTNARGCAVRATLGAASGATVRLALPGGPPVIGIEPSGAAGGAS
jgi:NADH-quinone oxidoreductase subunit G